MYSSFMRFSNALIMAAIFASVSLLLFVTFTHSLDASINRVLFSLFDFLRTIIHVAILVPKNRLSGS